MIASVLYEAFWLAGVPLFALGVLIGAAMALLALGVLIGAELPRGRDR